MNQEFDIVQEVLAQFEESNDLVEDVLAEFVAGGPVQGFNGRGSSLVTSNSTPTGRTTGASSGFDMVDGVPVPEDRSASPV